MNMQPQESRVHYSADQIVSAYISIRDKLDAMSKAFAEQTKPLQDSLTVLESAAALLMKETQQTALKTEHGTAYQSHVLSAKVADREAFISFVFARHASQFLTAHVNKDSVKEFMEANNGALPPGVTVETIIKTNFRRS